MLDHGWRFVEVTAYGPSRMVKGAHTHKIDKPPRRKLETGNVTVDDLLEHIENPTAIDRQWAHQYLTNKSPQIQRAALEHLGTVERAAMIRVEIPNKDILQDVADTVAGVPREPWVKTDFEKLEADRKAAKVKAWSHAASVRESEVEIEFQHVKTWENSSPIERAIRGLEDPYAKKRSAFAALAKLGH